MSQTIPAEFGGFEASDAELQDALFGPVTPGADSSGATQLPAITVTPNDSAADSSIDYMQPIPGSEQSDLGAFLAAPGQVIRTHNYGQSAPDDAPLLIGGSGVDYGPRIGVVDYFNVIRGGIASFIPEGVRDFEYSRIVAESPRLSSVDNLEYDGITDYSVGNGKGWTLSLPTYGDVKAGLNKAYNALAATFGEGQNTRDVSGLEYKDIDSYPEDLGSGWRLSVPTGGQLVDYANAMYGRSLSASNAYRDAIEQDKHYRAGLAFGSDPIVQGLSFMVGAFGLTKPVSAYGRLGQNSNLAIESSYINDSGNLVANLSKRQQYLLSNLDEPGTSILIKKSDVNLNDLSSLTAETGNEFGIFSLGGRRMVYRGYANDLGLSEDQIFTHALEGWRFSGHTHPGISFEALKPSSGDRNVLKLFNEMGTQNRSVIQNSLGEQRPFTSNIIDDLFGL